MFIKTVHYILLGLHNTEIKQKRNGFFVAALLRMTEEMFGMTAEMLRSPCHSERSEESASPATN